jgi:hypothetical protein
MATKTSYVIAGVLAAGLAGWLFSGQLGGDAADGATGATPSGATTGTASAADEPHPLAVRVRDLR